MRMPAGHVHAFEKVEPLMIGNHGHFAMKRNKRTPKPAFRSYPRSALRHAHTQSEILARADALLGTAPLAGQARPSSAARAQSRHSSSTARPQWQSAAVYAPLHSFPAIVSSSYGRTATRRTRPAMRHAESQPTLRRGLGRGRGSSFSMARSAAVTLNRQLSGLDPSLVQEAKTRVSTASSPAVPVLVVQPR